MFARIPYFLLISFCLVLLNACHQSSKPAPSPAPVEKKSPSEQPLEKPKEAETTAVPAAAEPSPAVKTPDETPDAKSAQSEKPLVQGTASGTALGTSEAPPPSSMAQAAAKPETWTAQRILVMGRGGPRFIKVETNVGGQDLATGFAAACDAIAARLEINFDMPVEWATLLDKPLIASGWLGNLVPNGDQREQLLGLYDRDKDGKVNRTEFREFITRGLARTEHLRLTTRPSTAPRLPNTSPWGPLDVDADGELTAQELAQTQTTMFRFDFDGDRILTTGELQSATEATMPMNPGQSSGLLDITPVHKWDIDKPDRMVAAILEHYSFSKELLVDELVAWSETRTKKLDVNGDKLITEKELRAFTDDQVDAHFQIHFPNELKPNAEKLNVNYQSLEDSKRAHWLNHSAGGRLTLDGCIVTILLRDEQSGAIRESFDTRFKQVTSDAQATAFATQAFELKDGAWEVLKSAAEAQAVDASSIAWQWLVAPRHWHMQLVWSAGDSPWFELMDLNGDQKIGAAELEQFPKIATGWDLNKDGLIRVDEMPVSVLLEVRRPEARGLRSRLGGTDVEKRGANDTSAPTWFSGMDYNSDGELSRSEFLGDDADFEKLDRDRDGIIEAREVTAPQ